MFEPLPPGSSPFRQSHLCSVTPNSKSFRQDVFIPSTTPRRPRAPSIPTMTETTSCLDVDLPKLTVRVRGVEADMDEPEAMDTDEEEHDAEDEALSPSDTTSTFQIGDLPVEVQGQILDYIFGDLRSINPGTSTIFPGFTSIASLMRHPRRKAVSDVALVSRQWRDLVQERIYRHIKIKGTLDGIEESENWFVDNRHLTSHVRHIEFWVPVWGQKTGMDTIFDTRSSQHLSRDGGFRPSFGGNLTPVPADQMGFGYPLSMKNASLSQIFAHVANFFSDARVFTLEGGHCKKSNMIRHFPNRLFPDPTETLTQLPQITTFAMRGAWNIMREDQHWTTIEAALPNIEEWHCAYAKPRQEAYTTISSILSHFSPTIRHVNISLDGFYSKDNSISSSHGEQVHLCRSLGRIAPQLESLCYTGKICSQFWIAAVAQIRRTRVESRLRTLEVVVKKCCRPPITLQDPVTGETTLAFLDDVMADGAGITNMAFIRAFEKLVVSTVQHLGDFPLLSYVKIRFIDLDSPCALLNPYFQIQRGRCYGLWNEEILELLPLARPGLEFEELGEGINPAWRKEMHVVSSIYPRSKPKSIKASSYRELADYRSI